MKPSDIIQEASPVTITNIYTDFKPVEFRSQAAYNRWLVAQKSANQASPSTPPKLTPVQPRQQSSIYQGVTQVKPEGKVDVAHDYGDSYTQYSAGASDDEEDNAKASSIVADKAAKMLNGRGGDNSVLVNEFGERIIVQSFFSFPMIDDRSHQIFSASSKLDSGLYSAFSGSVNQPTTNKGRGKIQYGRDAQQPGRPDQAITSQAVQAASKAIASVFKGQPLASHQGRPIFWVNNADRAGGNIGSFALSHWIRIPPKTTLEVATNSGNVEHYIFGYYNTAGVPIDPISNFKTLFAGFSVGTIEQTMGFYGLGANALKRISALKPNRVLGLDGDYTGKTELEGLDYAVEGKVLKNPWKDLKNSISTAFAKTPVKRDKLLEITDQIIGKGPSEPGRYPITIKGISVQEVGFSTNALTVDFMEIIHPMVAMKPNGVINNGIYNAAHTYLGSPGDDGKMTFNLQDCVVGYPSAANAKLFDSVLINRKTGGRLLISSKDGEGAMPSAGSLGGVYNLFESHLDFFTGSGEHIDPQLGEFITRTMGEAPTEFREMMRFFSTLGRGGNSERIEELMPKSKGAKELARHLIDGDKIAEYLNTWDGGSKFGGGKFLQFCSGVLRFTPLVQINTLTEKKDTPEFDRADDLTVTGFMATWPNKLFDNMHFEDSPAGLRFKIDVGGGTGEVKTRQPDNNRGERVYKQEPRFDKWMGRSYEGPRSHTPRYTYTSKINKMKVPGFGGSWNVLVNRLSGEYEDFLKDTEDALPAMKRRLLMRNSDIMELYNAALKFQTANGFDPGISKVPGMTMRDLMNTIKQAQE